MARNYLSFCLIAACFISGIVANKAILRGIRAKPHQFPYQVALKKLCITVCGGGILTENFIITAARCIAYGNPSSYDIVVGAHNIQRRNKAYKAIKVYYPSSFYPERPPIQSDIAIVKLTSPIELETDHRLRKLDLPKHGDIFYGREGTVAGWGFTFLAGDDIFHGGRPDGELRFVDVKISEQNSANHNDIISAKVRSSDQTDRRRPRGVCTYDIGGPLVVGNVVVGVLSVFPDRCVDLVHPAHYSSVEYNLRFVENVLNNRTDPTNDISTIIVHHDDEVEPCQEPENNS